ncbi:MAG TPA: hypothetical protein VFE82_03495 [Ramlibacter sp.]|jgi:hypothetical protein|uniref:hypothetical protein n=1 Tax=Ramlibacter sp. TaxID=1917967 RepID=UPI002D5DB306|nr:hypothetical protein [Ramlibacter sp.]HZY17516.1 hypothetical protein [Ramlibacter sp.]
MGLVQLSQPRSLATPVIGIGAAALFAAGMLAVAWPVVSVATALAALAGWTTLVALMFIAGRSRQVYLDSDSRRIIIEWRNILLAKRRKEFLLDRFGSVLSYYAISKSHDNWVCLMEHAGKRGVHIASYDFTRNPRSFWDLAPPVVESEGARELRTQLSSSLGLRDDGFVPARWPVKESE